MPPDIRSVASKACGWEYVKKIPMSCAVCVALVSGLFDPAGENRSSLQRCIGWFDPRAIRLPYGSPNQTHQPHQTARVRSGGPPGVPSDPVTWDHHHSHPPDRIPSGFPAPGLSLYLICSVSWTWRKIGYQDQWSRYDCIGLVARAFLIAYQ